jgi:hypothetical protein
LPSTSARVLRDLRELLAALDRRVPQAQREGEPSISRDAAALRLKTLERIAELDVQHPEFEPPR